MSKFVVCIERPFMY